MCHVPTPSYLPSSFYGTGRPHYIVLCFIALCRYCVFYKLKVDGNPLSSKSIGSIFPKAFVHFVSLGRILVILAVFQALHYYIW